MHTILIMSFLTEYVRNKIIFIFWWNMVKEMLEYFLNEGFNQLLVQ